jgi:predicted nucleotidyltransferase
MSKNSKLDGITRILEDFPQICLVYLFGSQVSGQVGPMSDYDFGLVVEQKADEITLQAEFRHALVKLLGTDRIDVVILNNAPIELAYHIISTGELLFHREEASRVEFEAQVLGLYGDYLPFLRANKQAILDGDAHEKRIQWYREALRRTQRTTGTAGTSSGAETR